MTRVFNLSGGKSSAYMTILEKPTTDDIVLFTDTGREHPATYKFLDEIEKQEGFRITARPIPTGGARDWRDLMP
jgi:3'-phosphoadenosine 5'-phosphosulfate sulfotransferase (PAPS reductase)/FAD synthetase